MDRIALEAFIDWVFSFFFRPQVYSFSLKVYFHCGSPRLNNSKTKFLSVESKWEREEDTYRGADENSRSQTFLFSEHIKRAHFCPGRRLRSQETQTWTFQVLLWERWKKRKQTSQRLTEDHTSLTSRSAHLQTHNPAPPKHTPLRRGSNMPQFLISEWKCAVDVLWKLYSINRY